MTATTKQPTKQQRRAIRRARILLAELDELADDLGPARPSIADSIHHWLSSARWGFDSFTLSRDEVITSWRATGGKHADRR